MNLGAYGREGRQSGEWRGDEGGGAVVVAEGRVAGGRRGHGDAHALDVGGG